MILQVLADAGQVADHANAEFAEFRRRPDAGELQQLWRVDRAGRDDHLAARPHLMQRAAALVAHARRAPPLEQDARREGVGAHGEVGAPHRSEEFYDVKSTVFAALIDTIDLSQLAKLDIESAREEIRDIVNALIDLKAIVM